MGARGLTLDRKRFTRVLVLCLLVLTTCITLFDPELTNEDPKLTVDGLITDQPGPYRVHLTYSTAYTVGNAKSDVTIFDATVYIKDDLGNEEQLTYTKGGFYLSKVDGIRGEVGRSYSVRVELSNGKIYESIPEYMAPAPDIDTLYAIYRDVPEGFVQGEIDVFVETNDPVDEDNYYLWRWNNYNRIDFCVIWFEPGSRIQYGNFCCNLCFDITTCKECINIERDRYTNGNRLVRPLLTFPYNRRTPYFVEAQQFSITKAAYEYWQQVAQLTANTGGVFDKPPISIKGNLYNTENDNERVLGFFGASAIKTKSAYFSRSGFLDPPHNEKFFDNIVPDYRKGCIECEESPGLRTAITPAHWDDAPTYYPVVY
jgi:hypothetical protein